LTKSTGKGKLNQTLTRATRLLAMPAPDPDGVYISEHGEGRITVTHEGYLWSNAVKIVSDVQ